MKSLIKILLIFLTPNILICQQLIWQNDFSNSADWTLDNTCNFANSTIYDTSGNILISSCSGNGTNAIDPNTNATAQWRFETDPNLIPVSAQSPFMSLTATNGYLFIDSDAIGGGDGDGTPIYVTATTATAIDLSNQPYVELSFSHNYRWWQDTRGVRVSGDNGASWVQYEITNNLGYPGGQNSGNPEITNIDISSVAGSQSQVLIQFFYEDNDFWAWYWAVDDVKITSPISSNTIVGNWRLAQIPKALA
ncbi:MAG: hypothetical protein VW078_10265, partial [Flavobacteriales bacterium]